MNLLVESAYLREGDTLKAGEISVKSSSIINKYCALDALKNESDVEQFFVLPLLVDLGYDSDYLETKATITQARIGKGRQKKLYYPDYLAYATHTKEKPVLVIDAKHPYELAEDGVQDAQLYTSVIRRKMAPPKPEQYCIGVNGSQFIVKHYDSDAVFTRLSFEEFQDGNTRFVELKSKLGREALRLVVAKQSIIDIWNPWKPTVDEIKAVFQKCHKRIWKREALLPTAAFYEFTKLIFLKLREDERLRRITEHGKEVAKKDLHFHTEWIDNNSEVSPNPINSILFRTLVEDLDAQVIEKKKKPIEAVEERLNQWEEARPEKVSMEENVKINGSMSRVVWTLVGITAFVWRNTGLKTCAYCQAMNGKGVGVDEKFVPAGVDFSPPEADGSLKIRGPKSHPPLHQGCDCIIEISV